MGKGKEIKLTFEELINIKKHYLSGISSNKLSEKLKIPRAKIVKILKEENIFRYRKISDDFYKGFWEENGKWFGYWKCELCDKEILFSVNEKSLLNRNIKRKKVCRECYSENQKGCGNPFFGKTHSPETIEKMLNSQRKTLKQISKAEIEIYNDLIDNGYRVIQQKIIGKPFDLYLPEYNLLIEYNGDYWHCNPLKYKSDYFNKKLNKTAKEIWDKDLNKLYLGKNNGYYCEVIWETDYKKDNKIIYKILEKYVKK